MKSLPIHHYDDQVIYPASKMSRFLILLIVCKVSLSFCYFLMYDMLKVVHVVHFLFIAKTLSSLFLILIQKPFSSGKPLNKNKWFGVIRHSVFQVALQLLWLFGLSLCGPLRTVLLYEHKTIIVVTATSALFTSNGDHAKLRGAFCFLAAILSLLFLDHDDARVVPTEHPEGQHHSGISHAFYFIINWIGLADHKGGVLLLTGVVCLQALSYSSTRHLSVEIGGAKRLNALTSLISSLLLAPWAFLLRTLGQSSTTPWASHMLPLFIVVAIVFVLDFYVEASCGTRLEAPFAARAGSIAAFVGALLISIVWVPSFNGSGDPSMMAIDHRLSGGVIFSFFAFVVASVVLSGATKQGSKANFVGYSSTGAPLYSFNIPGTSQSTYQIVKNGLSQILKESDSKKIFYFLCLNLLFTFVELIYGLWANSLGLISDGFHMLFDCSALLLGLCAALLARKKPTKTFPYGYGRVEILSGFVNGLFLIVVALMVFSAAVSRILEPPEIITEKLLTVSILGLIVNCIGILVFRHSHSHGGSAHNHGHSHGHDHGHSHNANIHGVFLHVLADTLGSVGVIVSSLLIDRFGLLVADPICSLFISLLIFLSVLPLLKQSSHILLLGTPPELETGIRQTLYKVLQLEGVQSYSQPRFWEHVSGVYHAAIHIRVSAEAAEQKIVNQVHHLFKELGISHITVQVEKEQYFHYLSGIGNTMAVGKETNSFSNAPPSVKLI